MAAEKIFLIGLMGSGKSYWSKKMSKWIKSAGYDLDALIEMNEEKTIAELFAEDGEEYFRKTETKLLKWFKEKKKYVLATGGGTPCFNENMQWMKKEGIVIWLDESVDVLVQRLVATLLYVLAYGFLSHGDCPLETTLGLAKMSQSCRLMM